MMSKGQPKLTLEDFREAPEGQPLIAIVKCPDCLCLLEREDLAQHVSLVHGED
jgi:hypothetical protein